MEISAKTIKESAALIVSLGVILGGGLVSYLIYLLVGGAVANVASTTTVAGSNNSFTDAITNVSTKGAGFFETTWGQLTLVISLIAIVVIMLVFGFGKKKKGSGMY